MASDTTTIRQATNLKRILHDCGINQVELSRGIHISKTSVNKWCKGHTPISEGNALLVQDFIVGNFNRVYSVEYIRGIDALPDHDWEIYENRRAIGKQIAQWLSDTSGILFDEGYDLRHDINGIQVTKDAVSVALTPEQSAALVTEFFNYMEMRLDSILERGCW